MTKTWRNALETFSLALKTCIRRISRCIFSLVLYAFKATIRESAFKGNLSTDCYRFKSFSKVVLAVVRS